MVRFSREGRANSAIRSAETPIMAAMAKGKGFQ
jgi:hypothetical protein